MSEVMANIHDGIIILFASFSVPSFLASFKHFWSNETGKRSLSKVVQLAETTCNSIFRRFGLILVEIFVFITMVPTHKFLFFRIALWSNETGKVSLSKVVQQVRNYL